MALAPEAFRRSRPGVSLVILVEEPSMEAALKGLLPRLGVDEVTIIPHQGVSELEASLPRKLRAWTDPRARFLIIRDNDRGDCSARKSRLLDIVRAAGREDRSIVRIVCQELEAWFLAQPEAMEAAGYHAPGLRKLAKGDVDLVPRPKATLRNLFPGYQQTAAARAIGAHLDPRQGRSRSFAHVVEAIEKLNTGA